MSAGSFVARDAQEASAACARKILELLADALAARPAASLAISGGSTPKLLFAELAHAGFDWSRVHLFWVDERGVAPDDPQSNYKLAREHFIDPAHFPPANVHRVQAELEPPIAAERYAAEIRRYFKLRENEFPQFDIIHRGMGPDAHTASLFPGEQAIDDHRNLVAAVYVEKFQQWRITLLAGVLEEARNTVMLVAGEDKAEPLRAVLSGPFDPKQYPAQIATRDRLNVTWFLDETAARLLH
jgi:6-phosphogluconolactonase